MSRIVIVGGSVAGLACALVLAADGHQVHILERDAEAHLFEDPAGLRLPGRHSGRRPGTPHSDHAHLYLPLTHEGLRRYAPDVLDDLRSLGCREVPLTEEASGAAGEESMVLLARRALFEAGLRRAVLQRSGVTHSAGVNVTGLCFADSGTPPRVTGVRTARGRSVLADVVIAATGRHRDQMPAWLSAGGVSGFQDQREPCYFTQYTRFYQLLSGAEPGPLDEPCSLGGFHDAFACKLMLADNDMFAVAFGVLPQDTELKRLREAGFFAAAAASIPAVAEWVQPSRSRSVTDAPTVMAGLQSRLRRLMSAEGTPAVLGLHLAGDSLCTTNPVLARGVSLALHHAMSVGAALREHPDDLQAQAVAVDRAVAETTAPSYFDAVARDRTRVAAWKGVLDDANDGRVCGFRRLPTRRELLRSCGQG